MKKTLMILTMAAAMSFYSCGGHSHEKGAGKDSVSADGKTSFHGGKVNATDAIPAAQFDATVGGAENKTVTVTGKVHRVCQGEGCWMTVQRDSADKDGIFFNTDHKFAFPKDCEGKNVTITGVTAKDEDGKLIVKATGGTITTN